MNPDARRHIRLRRFDEIERIQCRVLAEMEAANYSRQDIFSVQLALDETITNAIKHGNGTDPSKQVTVAFRVNADEVWIEVEDEGDGFSISEVPDPTDPEFIDRPGGRGVFFVQRFMCSVQYNDRGNRVTMRKRRSSTLTESS